MNSIYLLATAALLISTTGTGKISAESTSQSAAGIELQKQSCCSFKKFTCNNETGPLDIACSNETAHLLILLPYKSPDDNFTFILNDDGSGRPKQLATLGRNYTEPQFCIGWRNDRNISYDAAIVCYNPIDLEEYKLDEENLMVFMISGICLLCSVFFALLTLVVYCLLPWLRDLQGRIIISLLISICIGYSTLSYIQLVFDVSNNTCIITGFMVYYWCFATFTWLHISCFNIWRTVVLSRSHYKIFKKPKQLFALYSLFAWGVPALFLIAALLVEFVKTDNFTQIKPRMGESRCWFHSRQAIWVFFYSPMLIIILTNILYFISVVIQLRKIHKVEMSKSATSNGITDITQNNTSAKIKLKRLKMLDNMMQKNRLYLKLFFAMGVTFIFELISDLYLNNLPESLIARIIFHIMDIINALQGLVLFIVLILTRRRVLEALFNKLQIPIRYLPFKNDSQVDGDENNEDEENDQDDQGFMTEYDDEQQLTNNTTNRQNTSNQITEEIQMT